MIGTANEVGAGNAVEFEDVAAIGYDSIDGWRRRCEGHS